MSYQKKYVYNGELDKDVLHLPLFSIIIHGKDFQTYYQCERCQRGRHRLQQSKYADDTALLAGNERELSELINKINEVGKQFGMKINIKKTKEMVVSKKPNSPKINIAIDGEQIEQVTSYMYLGSLITDDGRSEKEIKRRPIIARSTFTNMRALLSCRGINLKTRLRAIKCYIWPALLYGAETWTITKSLLSRLDVFEMWVYRRVLKISWTEKITNEEVLRRMGTGREIVRQFKTRKLQYLGYRIRHNFITNTTNRRKDRRQKILRPTKKYLDK